jgi:hypothetical protein
MKHTFLILTLMLASSAASSQTLSNLIWVTNRPQAVLTVDLTSTLLVNGQPVGTGTGSSGQTNFIPVTNGIGIQTTLIGPIIKFTITNVVLSIYSTVKVNNSSNSLVNGTYIADNDRSDVLYNNWPAQLWGGWTAYSIDWKTNLYLIFTNTVCANGLTNSYQICMGSSPSWWLRKDQNNWNPAYYLDSLTNTPYFSQYATLNPNAEWFYGGQISVGNNPTSTATAFSTTPASITLFDGQKFVPLTHQWVLDATSYTYSMNHGLGHTPHMVEWSLLCIHEDIGVGSVPGEALELHENGANNGSATYILTLRKTPTQLFLTTTIQFLHEEILWQFANKDQITPGQYNHPTSFTNFVLQVEFYP